MKNFVLISIAVILMFAASVGTAVAQTPQPTQHFVQSIWTPSTSSGITEQHVMRVSVACPTDKSIPAGLTKIGTVLGNVISTYDDHTALAGQPYCYTIRAFNGFDESADSNTSQAVIPFPPNAPTAVSTTVQK